MTVSPEVLSPFGLIGNPEDADLKAIARLAAHICGVPTATVNLLDTVSQHSVATHGFPRATVPVDVSFCQQTVRMPTPLHVRDASKDPRFSSNPHVTGELRTIAFYAGTQLRTSDGLTVGTLCVFDDVPHELDAGQRQALDDLAAQAVQVLELRRRTHHLEATNTELHRSNVDLAAFTGRIAHDLRNPIAAAGGFLSLATGAFGDELTGRARECVEHAAAANARMAELVDDLLSYAAVDAKTRLEAVDVASLVGAVAVDLRSLLQTTRGRLSIGDLPTVKTDSTLLRQLLQNFVTNGLKYSRPDVPPVVLVDGSVDASGWQVSVADNGRGIPEADRDAVFDLFVRLPGGRDIAGSGIGLATCARIAEALGGQITISDSDGGGVTFTLAVPTGRSAPVSSARAGSPPHLRGSAAAAASGRRCARPAAVDSPR